MLKSQLVLVSLLLLCGARLTTAQETDFSSYTAEQALAYSQQAIGRQLQGIQFTDSSGEAVKIEDYRGQPLVLSLIYTSCHHVCPSTTRFLGEVVKKARSALDDDSFQVLSIGFDTVQDSPERMASFAGGLGIDHPNWAFLSLDEAQRDALVEQLGFIYYPSPKGFEHLIQASILDGEGRVYRQVYGMSFPTPALIEPLKELVFGDPQPQSALEHLSNRIRLFCTVYDPATDSYSIDISVFIGTFVGLVVSLLFGRVLWKEWRRSIEADR